MADTTIDSIVAQAVAAAEAASAAADTSGSKKKGTPMSAKTKARLQADLAKAKTTAAAATKAYQNTPSSAANYAQVKQANDSAINAINNIQDLLKANVEPAAEKAAPAKTKTAPTGPQFTSAQVASYQYAQGLQSTLAEEYADLQNKINLYSRGAANPGDKAALEKAANDYKSTFAALQTAYQKSGVVQGDVQIDPATGALAAGTSYVDPLKPQEGVKTVTAQGTTTAAPAATTAPDGSTIIPGNKLNAPETAAFQGAVKADTTPAPAPTSTSTSGAKTGQTPASKTKDTNSGPMQFVPVMPGQTPPGAIQPYGLTPFESANSATQQQFVQQFGGLAAMAFSTPWIAAILDQAIAGKWDAKKFADTVSVNPEFAKWGKAVQDENNAYYGDPTHQSWAQQYNDKLEILQQSALRQGLDPSVFGSKIDLTNPTAIKAAFDDKNNGVNAYLTQYYANTPTQEIIDQYVSNHAGLAKNAGGALGGTLAATAQDLKSYAASMGVASQYLTPSWAGAAGQVNTGSDYWTNAALAIQQGKTTSEAEKNLYRQQAQNIYKPFAQQIADGYSVSQLASPYTSAVQNLMELGNQPIDLGSTTGYSAMITKALQGDGTNPMNLDQFTTQLKQRPEWLQTGNARNSLMDTATQLLRNFGMVVGG